MGFSRQAYWSGLPFPTPGDLPHPGIAPTSPASAGGFFTTDLSGSLDSWEKPTRYPVWNSILEGVGRKGQYKIVVS